MEGLARAVAVAVLMAVVGLFAPAMAQDKSSPSPTTPPTAPPDVEFFFRPPDIEAAVLSPSGRWLALTTGLTGKRTGLVVFDLQLWKPLGLAARLADADIEDVHWIGDERLVFSVRDRSLGGGEQRWWPGLYAVSRDGQDFRTLVQVAWTRVADTVDHGRGPLPANHTLLHVPAGDGDAVVVGEWRWGAEGTAPEILAKRLNVRTGRAQSLALGVPDGVRGWLFDPQGQPRLVVTRQGARGAVHWRTEGAADGDKAWRVLAEYESIDPPFTPRFIDAAGVLYVTTNDGHDGVSRLRRFDFATGKPEEQALVSTPGFDFAGLLVAETTGGKALGVRVLTDGETTVWFDKRLAALQEQADRRLHGRVNRISCRRCDAPDMTALVFSYSDRDPGQFWIHTAADGAWRKVGDVRRGVDPRRMAGTDFFRVKARDGLEIPVWLTLPPGPAQPRAAVVLVHGGPWTRGRQWRWSSQVQFLASRGYAVIEPEFRGSTGYGQRLFRAGWRQWGQAMQDDVADALAWAVAQGHVDAKRACVAGGSYGGYATLMGLIRHPDLYRCGAAWVAVTDPRLLFEWRYGTDQSDDSRQHTYPTLIGDPIKDAAMLERVTPVLQAGQIRAPLLLAFGGADRRVPIVHGNRLREALVAAGRPPQWVVYPDEGHGWSLLDNQLDFARRLEAFLAENLKP